MGGQAITYQTSIQVNNTTTYSKWQRVSILKIETIQILFRQLYGHRIFKSTAETKTPKAPRNIGSLFMQIQKIIKV